MRSLTINNKQCLSLSHRYDIQHRPNKDSLGFCHLVVVEYLLGSVQSPTNLSTMVEVDTGSGGVKQRTGVKIRTLGN